MSRGYVVGYFSMSWSYVTMSWMQMMSWATWTHVVENNDVVDPHRGFTLACRGFRVCRGAMSWITVILRVMCKDKGGMSWV